MRRFVFGAGGLLALLACSGCYESRISSAAPRDGVGGLDGGSVVASDGGARPDSAVPLDAGLSDGGALGCTAPIRDYAGPRCQPATLACLATCTDAACEACYDADPACLLCIYQSIGQCVNALGCRDEWEAFACCADRSGACADLEVQTLLFECGGACPAEIEAWGDCLNDALARDQCTDAPSARCLP